MKNPLKLSLVIAATCFAAAVFAADAPKSMRGIDVAAPDPVAAEKAYVGKRPGTQPAVVKLRRIGVLVVGDAVPAPHVRRTHLQHTTAGDSARRRKL